MELDDAARRVGDTARRARLTVVAAESVTAGSIATALAAAPGASEWFAGSIVAYRTAMKRDVLGVAVPSVISVECAREMAEGALRATGADAVVSTTGVGGPDPEEGRPAGTVLICAGRPGRLRVTEHRFDGGPDRVVNAAVVAALNELADAMAD